MSREIRSILGYSSQDVVRLNESTTDDLVAAYRELISQAKAGGSFEDLTDGLIVFLDVASSVDPDGQLDEKLAGFLRDKIMSDEFRDMARSVLALIGESAVFNGQRMLCEGLDDFDLLLQTAQREIRTARDFTEAAVVVSGLVNSLKARSVEAAAVIDSSLLEQLEDLLSQLDKPLRRLAAQAG